MSRFAGSFLSCWCLIVLSAAFVVGCDGGEADVDGGGIDSGTPGPCEGMPDGTACGTDRVCMAEVCVAASDSCGDGTLDDGEQCDDGNRASFDGCDADCTFTCEDDVECSDGSTCNGEETCNTEIHACEAGTALPVGDPCPLDDTTTGVCAADNTCIVAGCQNGVLDGAELCDDGNDVPDDGCEPDCTFSCTDDTHCDDTVFCNGAETCDLTTHLCQPGTTVTCTESDACHSAECSDAEARCVEELIDGDGDGEAATLLGACGTDCDDGNMSRARMNAEICGNGIDDDCNPATADAAMTLYYSDCDNDGFAAMGATGILACDAPANCGAGCGCTATPPTSLLNTDCNDGDRDIRPGVSELPGDEVDQNCDGAELCYLDMDNDGYRPNGTATVMSSDTDCGDSTEARGSEPTGDCADANGSISPGRSEVTGDEVDQNCDGRETCYVDADNDGYRTSATVSSVDSDCDDSGEAASSAGLDCLDTNPDARPNQTTYFASNASGLSPSYDYNCNDNQDKRYTCSGISTTGSCGTRGTFGCFYFVCTVEGWTSSSVPACGASATYTYCRDTGTSCVRTTVSRTQTCR